MLWPLAWIASTQVIHLYGWANRFRGSKRTQCKFHMTSCSCNTSSYAWTELYELTRFHNVDPQFDGFLCWEYWQSDMRLLTGRHPIIQLSCFLPHIKLVVITSNTKLWNLGRTQSLDVEKVTGLDTGTQTKVKLIYASAHFANLKMSLQQKHRKNATATT
jgi:hypothetical protein